MARKEQTEPAPSLMLLDERACAFQKSVVFLRGAYPNGAVMTYDNTRHRGSEHVLLAKFVIGIGETEPVWLTWNECTDKTVSGNIPGGLTSNVFTSGGDNFTVTWYPLLYGEAAPVWEGAALLHIHSELPKHFWLKFGNGNIAFMHLSPNEAMAGSNIDCQSGWVERDGSCIIIRREERALYTAVHGNFDMSEIKSLPDSGNGRGTYAVTKSFGTDIYAVVSFSEDILRAEKIAMCDAAYEESRVKKYYADLLSSWKIDTPEPMLNEAFQHALLNVEYSWLSPYGWIESLQHWPTMWHMEHTAAEEWNGRYERTLKTLRTQMQNAFPSGAIPDMCPDGSTRRDWGGNNQFFFREVEHYIKMTGDISFAAEAEPYMEKALVQTFGEYDPTGSGIIGWGTQIGNQEDFESTPGKGAATGIEGARMLEIMSYIKSILGKADEASQYAARASFVKKEWYKKLWQRDIGRPVWYEDIHGEKRLETTYHGIIYPVIYDAIDDADKFSALDHLRHRLSGPEGEIYQTNHFADHAYDGIPTWGMQCGSNMQAFATAAYAAVGMKNEAVQPLIFIAKRVCGEYQKGSWPETANEKRYAYFSPSAAVFSQAVIESIFGLKRDKTAGITTITPAIPEHWPHAALHIPEADIEYTSHKNGSTIHIKIHDSTTKLLRVLCPPSSVVTAQTCSNGAASAPFHAKAVQHCGWSSAEFDLGTGSDITVMCSWEPININCEYDKVAVCGEAWSLSLSGDVRLAGVYDRCNVFEQLEISDNKVSGIIRTDILKPYERYGWFGKINFARRIIYLKLALNGDTFLYPAAITVLPDLFCKSYYDNDKKTIRTEIYNQTGHAFSGTWSLLYGEHCLSAKANAPGRQKSIIEFSLKDEKICFSPGKNKAFLTGPACISIEAEIEAEAEHAAIAPIHLDKNSCKHAEYWREIGLHTSHGHMMQGPDYFMKSLFEEHEKVFILPHVPLELDKNGYIPFSKEKHPIVTIPLGGLRMKKLYILISAFIDNHDVFSRVLRIEAEADKKDAYIRPVFCYDCYYPGQLDMGFGSRVIANFATFVNGTDRNYVPVMPLSKGQTDYPEAMPPAYPQRAIWCSSRAVEYCDTVFNLIELDFGKFRDMKEVRFIACEADSAGGIYAISAHIEDK